MNKVNSLIIAAAFLSVTTVANAATDANSNNTANVESTSVSLGFKSSTVKRFNKLNVSGKKVEKSYEDHEVSASNSFAPGFNSPTNKRFNKLKVSGKKVVEVETAYKIPKRFISRGFTLGSNS